MAVAMDTGLERLIQLDTVNLTQNGSGFTGNKYRVHSQGDVLFDLKEEGHALTFLSKGSSRGFHIDGVDSKGQTVFTLRRPPVFMKDKVEMNMNQMRICVIRREPTFVTPLFTINDGLDHPMLRLKGEITDLYNFQLQTKDKATIGSIKKTYRGLLKEMFSTKDDYVICFPLDLDVRYKLAVIGACIFIDYKYHES